MNVSARPDLRWRKPWRPTCGDLLPRSGFFRDRARDQAKIGPDPEIGHNLERSKDLQARIDEGPQPQWWGQVRLRFLTM